MIGRALNYLAILLSLLVSGSAFADVELSKLLNSGKSLKQVVDSLEDDHIAVETRNCNKAQVTCLKNPYEVKTCGLFTSDSKCQQIKARNIERRNQWLLESGKFKTAKGQKYEKVKTEGEKIETAIEDYREAAQNYSERLEEDRSLLQSYQNDYQNFSKQKDKLESQILKIQEENPDIRAGNPSLGEDFKGLFTGRDVDYDEQDKEDIERLTDLQKSLREVRRESGELQRNISSKAEEVEDTQKRIETLESSMQDSENLLKHYEKAYDQMAGELDNEGAQQRAYVDKSTLNAKKKAAKEYAKAKIRELEDDRELADILVSDYDSLAKDMKINELEAQALLNEVNGTIKDSVIGNYIHEQMQKTLETALSQSCQSAPLCSSQESVNNEMRQQLIDDGIERLYQKIGAEPKKLDR